MKNKALLKVDNLSKIYHTKQGETLAVDGFSLELNQGDFISIVGPSGCGKSTVLSMLCGLLEPSSGTISYADEVKIGYMLQQDCLFEWRTILDNCLLGLEIEKKVTDLEKQRVISLLETYGLKEFINSYPSRLSGGMRQRVALIRTLACNPDIIFLDEPYSALDYQSRLLVADDIYEIIKKENKSAIMVTHNLSEAISTSDKIIVLSKRPGKIKNIYSIKLSVEGKPSEKRKAKEFHTYHDKIWKDIDLNDQSRT